jgi:hypothetical protein
MPANNNQNSILHGGLDKVFIREGVRAKEKPKTGLKLLPSPVNIWWKPDA